MTSLIISFIIYVAGFFATLAGASYLEVKKQILNPRINPYSGKKEEISYFPDDDMFFIIMASWPVSVPIFGLIQLIKTIVLCVSPSIMNFTSYPARRMLAKHTAKLAAQNKIPQAGPQGYRDTE